jgi:hypothetical protein
VSNGVSGVGTDAIPRATHRSPYSWRNCLLVERLCIISASCSMENQKMNSSAPDPYYVARDAVNQAVAQIRSSFQNWERCSMEPPSGSGSFAETTRRLIDDIDHLEEDLSVIDGSIKAVEANPQRYPLRPGELDLRKQWASTQRRLCAEIRAKATGAETKARIEADRRKSTSITDEQSRQRRVAEETNSASIGKSKEMHQQIIAQQDDTLNELARVTDRLGQTGVVINTELQDQQRLLHELDQDIDRQQEKMNYVMGKMAKLLKTSDTKQLVFVLILLVIAVVLFVMNLSV